MEPLTISIIVVILAGAFGWLSSQENFWHNEEKFSLNGYSPEESKERWHMFQGLQWLILCFMLLTVANPITPPSFWYSVTDILSAFLTWWATFTVILNLSYKNKWYRTGTGNKTDKTIRKISERTGISLNFLMGSIIVVSILLVVARLIYLSYISAN